jgi:hypothetical protein
VRYAVIVAANLFLAPISSVVAETQKDMTTKLAVFIQRSHLCADSKSTASRQAAKCDTLKQDKAALKRYFHDVPQLLEIISHPETVRSIGYSTDLADQFKH